MAPPTPSNEGSSPRSGPSGNSKTEALSRALDTISNTEFNEWYREKQFEDNILAGKEYFNGPSRPKDPEQHSPT